MSLFISGNISPCETLVPCHGGELGQEEEEPSLQSFIAMTQESFGRESICNPLHSVSGWFILCFGVCCLPCVSIMNDALQ